MLFFSKSFASPVRIFLLILFLSSLAACGGKGSLPSRPTAVPVADLSWLHITYPSGWRETAPGHFEGADGYAWLDLRDSAGAGPGAVCMGEANRGKPQAYGAYPEIRDLALAGQPACLILPSADQPAARSGEALYLLWVPAAIRSDTLLALHADRAHILAISQSLAFARPLPTPPPSACDFSVSAQAPRVTRQNGLRIDEFPIARGAYCSPEREPVSFFQRVQSGPPARRADALRQVQYSSARLKRLNARLAPFGMWVEVYDQRLFRVIDHGTVALSDLSWVGPISLSANGEVFYMPVVDNYNGASYLIRPDGVHSQDSVNLLAFDLVFPVYAGPDRITLAYDYERIPRPTGLPALLQILNNDRVVQTFSISGGSPASGPARGMWSYQNHWYLELPGLVLRDGAILNDQLGYPEMFTWRLIDDRPFYFYRKDGLVHAVYNDQALPNPYDDVLYQPQWTDKMLVQMHAYENGLIFYARRGDTWYYVTLAAEQGG